MARVRFAAAFVVALFLHPAHAGSEITARAMQRAAGFCQHGMKALNAGDLPRAGSDYDKALAIVPSYPDAHMGVGHIRMRQSRFEDALVEYERARDGIVALGEALLDLRLKRFQETQRQISGLRDQLRSLQSALAANENAVGSTSANPQILERQIVQVEEAIRSLESVEPPNREAPRDPPGEIDFHIGNAQFRLGRTDDALRSWEACATKSPKFALVQNNLAVAYWKKGRLEDAKKSLARAVSLGIPVNPQFRADLDRAAEGAAPPAPSAGAPAKP